MKALRRSIKSEKEKPQPTIVPKSALAIVPPKKVIRALYDYNANSSQELSFSRGDFFHVIGREDDADWYEACNPSLPNTRGLVPVSFFQALGRNERDLTAATPSDPSRISVSDSGYGESSPGTASTPNSAGMMASQRQSRGSGKSGAMVYGIVMYDFKAERGDELEAKAGEAIIVIAQSDPEWFVAKPIGRLGGPGLIPVSFIEIRDMASNTPVPNPQETIRKAGIPRVEEWKKMAAEYKNSSISLGKFDTGSAANSLGPTQLEQGIERMSLQQQRLSEQTHQHQQQHAQQQPPQQYQPQSSPQPIMSPSAHPGPFSQQDMADHFDAPVAASIPRYCFADDKYWFVIAVILENGRRWELSRYYEDFYDFQIALLTEFPAEAGNVPNQKRTLPYMPGPVNYVTDAITEGRLHNLDAYVKNLLQQPPYISRCTLVKQFFAPREGDFEVEEFTEGPGPMPELVVPRDVKVKVAFDGDMIALRVSNSLTLHDFRIKMAERFRLPSAEDVVVYRREKDDTVGERDEELADDWAFQRELAVSGARFAVRGRGY